ncbi:MAG: hypothetical protein A2Y73_03510 [Chloroflexi bacterium RBG_13_56_8]|nr:MAG: hypothetical protein A2Y73_03510 [Chloroflexi bacterium RBG_13_56_8]
MRSIDIGWLRLSPDKLWAELPHDRPISPSVGRKDEAAYAIEEGAIVAGVQKALADFAACVAIWHTLWSWAATVVASRYARLNLNVGRHVIIKRPFVVHEVSSLGCWLARRCPRYPEEQRRRIANARARSSTYSTDGPIDC